MTMVEQQTSDAYIRSVLEAFGFSAADAQSLTDWAWGFIVAGGSEAEMTQQLYQRPEFKARHPWYQARQDAGLPQISVGEALAYERQAIQMFRAAGLPEGFYDSPDDFADFIAKDVSVAELSQRIKLAEDAVYNTPVEVRDELATFYGIGAGDLVAYFTDEERALPILERQYRAAETSGISRQTGYGGLTAAEAEGLVQTGVTAEQARQGFGELARGTELFTPLDLGEQAIGREEQLAGTFEGDAAARRKIEERATRRKNVFEQGGSFVTDKSGYSGLG